MSSPFVCIWLPLAAAALLAALHRVIPHWLASLAAIATATAVAFATIAMAVYSREAPIELYWFGGVPSPGAPGAVALVVDSAGAMLAVLAAALVTAALIFSYRYFDSVGGAYQALMLVLLSGMCGFCETGDLCTLLLFFELTMAALLALCLYHPEGAAWSRGAFHLAIANAAGATLVLAGIALVFARTGAFNMAAAGRALSASPHGFLPAAALALIACGMLLRAAIVPFHFWLSEGLVAAPAPVCAVAAGVFVELGIYGLVRLYWTVFSGALAPHQDGLRNTVAVFAAAAALVGALACYAQRNLKKLLAFATVSHSGVILLGAALLTPGALAGASIYLMGHALLQGGLFLAAGIVAHRFGVMDELHLLGRARHLRWTGALFFIGAIGLAGFPPFGIFWGDTMINGAAFRLGYSWIPWVSFFAAVITAAAVFRFGGRVFFGWGPGAGEEFLPLAAGEGHAHTPAILYIGATLLIVCGLLAGLAPSLTGAAESAALYMQNQAAYAGRVLDNLAPFPPTVHDIAAGPMDLLRGFAALLLAALLARQTLCSQPFRRAFGRFRAVPRMLLSGHEGDTRVAISWTAAGIAAMLSSAFFWWR